MLRAGFFTRTMMLATAKSASGKHLVTVAHGDGIGPEIMDATLKILRAANAPLEFETIRIGESVYKSGVSSGIEKSGWDSLNRTRLFLKAPITTPLGGGVKSLNVTVRKTLGLYSNVRPVVTLQPYVPSMHKHMDMIVVRENEEDLYAGIEHRHTSEVVQCIKLITIPGTERIVKYAFEHARRLGRRKVTCITKNNIMKLTDGMFYKVFQEVAAQYPEIASEHKIVDIATAQIATKPHLFDVIVTLNLYGDILSDVAADVAGSVGLAGSANIGDNAAMFEAVHGSAPDIAGRNIANPSGLLNAAVMMLSHIGLNDVGRTIKNAWLTTLEDGLHTKDIFRAPADFADSKSKLLVGTQEFADAVIDRLGKEPSVLRAEVRAAREWPFAPAAPSFHLPQAPVRPRPTKTLVGVDIFVDWDQNNRNADTLAAALNSHKSKHFSLQMISNRGVKVWPEGHPDTYKVNHWRCRFMGGEGPGVSTRDIVHLMQQLEAHGLEVIKTENLYNFDGEPGFSLGQGQ